MAIGADSRTDTSTELDGADWRRHLARQAGSEGRSSDLSEMSIHVPVFCPTKKSFRKIKENKKVNLQIVSQETRPASP